MCTQDRESRHESSQGHAHGCVPLLGRRIRRSWPTGLLALAAATAFWLGWQARQPSGPLVIEDAWLDFGTVWETRSFPWNLKVGNISTKPLKIHYLETSCACVECAPSSLTIGAGESAEIKLVLDFTKAFRRNAKASEAAFEATIAARLEPGSQSSIPTWTLKGMVRRPVLAARNPFEIHDRLTLGEEFPVQTMELQLHPQLRGSKLKAACPSQFGSVQCRHTGQTGDVFETRLLLNRRLTPGKISFDLEFEITPPENDKGVIYLLPVAGRVQNTVEILPSLVIAGAEPVGSTASHFVTLTAPGRVVVHGITSSHADVLCRPTQGVGVYQVQVTFSEKGRQERLVSFEVYCETQQRMTEVPLKVTYHGI